jgi:NitT/TauT family transport system substrate-binding protein
MLGLIVLLQTLVVAVSGPASSPEYLPLRVADAEGHFRREGLAVTLKTTRSEIGAAEALAQDQADIAATSLEAVLRFGLRPTQKPPLLVFALTAAPPVALLAATHVEAPVRTIADLRSVRVAVAAPGVPGLVWLEAVLARAKLTMTSLQLVSLGMHGVTTALERGDVQAGLVDEPAASQLIAEGHATLLADFRTPQAVARSLGGPGTVNAGVFVRGFRRPGEAELAAFGRALVAAEARIATATAEELGVALPRSVVGPPDEFARRLDATRNLYLPGGRVSAADVRATVEAVRTRLPLGSGLKPPNAGELLHLVPVMPAPPRRRD